MDTVRFQKDIAIDPNALDVAAATQGETFFLWAEKMVVAKKAMDRAKMNLELVENSMALRIRRSPQQFGLDKVTEGAIAATVKSSNDYLEAVDALSKAKTEAQLLEVGVNALEQRKRMIEILVTLHGQQYFAGPSVPRDLASAYAENRQNRVDDMETAQKQKARRRTTHEETTE